LSEIEQFAAELSMI